MPSHKIIKQKGGSHNIMDQRSRNAKELHDRCNVVDAHSDLLALDVWWQHRLGRKGVIEKDHVPKMKKGGIDTRVTVTYNEGYWFPELALKNALDMAVVWNEEFDESPSIARITKFEDIEKARKDGKIGLILGMEGAEPLSNDINLLQVFYTLGLRMLTLTHANRNYVGDGVHYLPQKEGNVGGITDFGVKVVEECNKLGIVIDVSHLNDPGFWDVMKFSKAPIVASHSNCRALANHPRRRAGADLPPAGSGGQSGSIRIRPTQETHATDPRGLACAQLREPTAGAGQARSLPMSSQGRRAGEHRCALHRGGADPAPGLRTAGTAVPSECTPELKLIFSGAESCSSAAAGTSV
jgi:hypothetical protein